MRHSAPTARRLLITDEGSEFQRLAYLDLATRRLTPLTRRFDWDVDRFDALLGRAHHRLRHQRGGVSRLYLLDTSDSAPTQVAGLPPGVLGGLYGIPTASGSASPSADPDQRVTPTHSTRDGQADALDRQRDRRARHERLSEPELIRWQSFDGREITGFYYRPPARFTGKRPVTHRYPRRARRSGAARLPRPGQLLLERAGRRHPRAQRARLDRLRQDLRQARQRHSARGHGQGHRRAARLDRRGSPISTRSRIMVDRRQLRRLHDAAVATTTPTGSAAPSTSSASPTSSRSWTTPRLPPRPAAGRVRRRARPGDARLPGPDRAAHQRRRRSPSRCSWSRARTTRGCREARPSRWWRRVKRNAGPVWYLMAKDEGHGFAKKANADFQFYATVEFIRTYLLGGAGVMP